MHVSEYPIAFGLKLESIDSASLTPLIDRLQFQCPCSQIDVDANRRYQSSSHTVHLMLRGAIVNAQSMKQSHLQYMLAG